MANVLIRLLTHSLVLAISIFYFFQIFIMFQKDEGLLRNLWEQHVFITNFTHTLVTFYYMIVTIHDLKELFSDRKNLQQQIYGKFVHTIFQLVFSLTLVVALMQWTLIAINPKLIWGKQDPRLFNAYFTDYYRHGVSHLLLYLELILYAQTVFISKLKRFLIDLTITVIYFIITAIQYFYFGKIVYAFQGQGPQVYLPIYLGVSVLFSAFDIGFSYLAVKVGMFRSETESSLGEVEYEEVEVVNKSD